MSDATAPLDRSDDESALNYVRRLMHSCPTDPYIVEILCELHRRLERDESMRKHEELAARDEMKIARRIVDAVNAAVIDRAT